MAFQSVPDTAEAVIQYLQNSVLFTNTYYFRYTGVYMLSDLQQLAADMDLWAATEMLPLLNASCTYVQAHVRGLDEMNDLEAIDATNTGVGANGSAPLPINVAWALKRLSGQTGRSARGRVYIGGLATGDLQADENFLKQTSGDGFKDAHSDQGTYLTDGAWTPVIVSRYSAGLPRSVGKTFNIDAWEYTDLRLDTRRDRLP